jgi:NhaP-type Na+/H+ or K+/H+ antiporter
VRGILQSVKAIEKAHLLRLAVLVLVALAGLGSASIFGWEGLEHSLPYILVASALLCFGLYMAVYGIDKTEAKRHWRVVLIAVTFGVLCKYLVIFLSAFLLTQNWEYAVLGMAVAQIDPLSVAALQDDPRMNPRTKTVLNMWASFDDPMTALATPFILGISANIAHQSFAEGGNWADVLVDILPFAAALLLVGFVALRRRMHEARGTKGLVHKIDENEKGKNIVAGGVGAAVVPARLYSLAALLGWFVRPKWLGEGRRAELLTNTALYGATFLLGVLLANGVDWKGGLILGVATYVSQILVAWLVMWVSALTSKTESEHKLSKRDTWHLALAQQNGITAIVLALNLEPFIDGAVAAVSLAIVVINLLNFSVNWVYDRAESRTA